MDLLTLAYSTKWSTGLKIDLEQITGFCWLKSSGFPRKKISSPLGLRLQDKHIIFTESY